jgi:hypothetical protein
MINEYNNEIRKDIALEFGLEAGGYAPRPTMLPIRVAQRIASKYPDHTQAVTIAKRYMSLVMGVK